MAVYEYECKNCKKVIEKHYKINHRSNFTVCPECGEMALVIPSVSSFHLKGGGWEKDGYGGTK